MSRSRKSWILSLLITLAIESACASPVQLLDSQGRSMIGATDVYTLVNLHPDNERSRLYAVNFQQRGLIPVCSQAELIDCTSDQLRFRVLKTNRQYDYINHKAAAEPFGDHLRRLYGHDCPAAEIQNLDEIDQRGIRKGKAAVGMTKRGVILALGPPPRHVTPDLDASEWMYWKNRFNRIIVVFDDQDRVVEIQD